ncbi:MAG: CoA transferase [Neomegalonema sp.]|nr:CoA transferase [Neomegalonema sp.]
MSTASPTSRAPLAGVVVLDLTHVLAGPYCSMTLAELGARVIKIERPEIGDDSREFGPFIDGQSAYFATINRDKESIALDLKDEKDRAVFDRMLARADVVLENYRPGVMERFGYGWEALHQRFPKLIYGAVSGFGHSGPWAAKPSYDMVVQAMGGVMSITGEKNREPVRCGASIGDVVAGMFLSQGVLAALYDRERSGLGRKVDVAMLDGQLAIIEHAVAIVEARGSAPGPEGARHPSIAPFETFHAKDGLIVIAAGNDALFAKACAVLGLDELAQDPRFATNNARVEHVQMLKRRFETVLLEQTTHHWQQQFDRAGVPNGPILDVSQTMSLDQIEARNMVVRLEADEPARAGALEMRVAGNPIKLSDAPDPKTRRAAPALDADRATILAWLDEPD